MEKPKQEYENGHCKSESAQNAVYGKCGVYYFKIKYLFGISGLFSTVPDLLLFWETLLSNGEYGRARFFSEDMIKSMYANQLSEIGEFAGLGWKLNQPSFMGQCPVNTCGMTGFTGSFVLWNKLNGVGLVMLANRTYPKRPTDDLAINKIRSALADAVFC